MSDLSEVSTDELKKELDRRRLTLPAPLDKPDWEHLTSCIAVYLTQCANKKYAPNYEDVGIVATQAVYGVDVFKWIKECTK